ncbi:sulfotransferase [Maricaulis sp.]|uniref:tetratricopeptide repeat-containing sulfotransferase family protein n=1 Tax=Maricaulis sp. TaxID=1486257 RepID=UPI003A950FDF
MTTPGELRNQAIAALKARDRPACLAALTRLNALEADTPLPWQGLARMADTLNACDLAPTLSAKALAQGPGQLTDHLSHLALMANCGQVAPALDRARSLRRAHGDQPSLNHLIGVLAAQMGESDAAIEALRAALERAPLSGASWIILVSAKPVTADDADYKRLESLRPDFAGQPPEAHASLLFALAKCRHDIGAHDDAFRDYQAGAAIMQTLRPCQSGAASALARQVIHEFDRAEPGLRPSQCRSDRPILVTGLPRSGTTLVEHILTSHPAVSGGGELNLLSAALAPVGQLSMAAARRFEGAGQDGWTGIGNTYLDMLNARFGPEGRIVDKSLNTAPMTGLIRHVLPDAPIIWIRRNPEDAALSCFRTWFSQGMEWTWSLTDIAAKFRAEDRLYHHWFGLYGDAILTVEYEALVAEPAAQIARMLAHCKLDAHPGLEEFHQTRRAVTTASRGQVRQALHAGSIDSARHYRQQMEVFRAAYQGDQ